MSVSNGEGLHLSPKNIGVVLSVIAIAILGTNAFSIVTTKGISSSTATDVRTEVLQVIAEDKNNYTEEEHLADIAERDRWNDVDAMQESFFLFQTDVAGLHKEVYSLKTSVDRQAGMMQSVIGKLDEIIESETANGGG